MLTKYDQQVKLLIKCFPAIREEKCFAIKGGTAINLFLLNLPRLSVDIDLMYLPIEDRNTTYTNIYSSLDRICKRLSSLGLKVTKSKNTEQKIFCSNGKAEIKIEPNYTLRGHLYEPKIMPICEKAENLFGFAKANIASPAELWGGKICAALDRQHPRDLFDIYNMFNLGGITEEIKNGFIFFLLSSNRPIHEMLSPNMQLKENVFESEFIGMTSEKYDFSHAEQTFIDLVKNINIALSISDRKFLIDFVQLEADLSSSPIHNLDQYPSILWKIKNLQTLKENNKEKFNQQANRLKEILF